MATLSRHWLRLLTYIGGLLPLGLLIWNYSQDQLTLNPIKEIQLRTGSYALVLLVLTLASTPLSRLLKSRRVLELRRLLGLFTFMYISLHFLNFLVLDYWFDFSLIREDLFEKTFALAGFSAFLLLLPLAVTSTRGWIVRLGRNWKRLHWLIFPAALLAVVHFFWGSKADVREALIYGVIVILLLALRLPVMKRLTARLSRQSAEDTEPGF
ncbi:MAG: protein-methionine-sulfoxide reductase heme-binding subunit MsrQ [Dehalococcoidales bacterium]